MWSTYSLVTLWKILFGEIFGCLGIVIVYFIVRSYQWDYNILPTYHTNNRLSSVRSRDLSPAFDYRPQSSSPEQKPCSQEVYYGDRETCTAPGQVWHCSVNIRVKRYRQTQECIWCNQPTIIPAPCSNIQDPLYSCPINTTMSILLRC